MVGVSNFRHAQYDAQGVGIDDPQALFSPVTQSARTGNLQLPNGNMLLPAWVTDTAQQQATQVVKDIAKISNNLRNEWIPTLFLDLSATVSGSGTLRSPYSPAQINSGILNGRQRHVALGIKRGTSFRGTLSFGTQSVNGTGGDALDGGAFLICPYGDSQLLPTIYGSRNNNAWAAQSQGVWRLDIPGQTSLALAERDVFQNNVRAFRLNSLALVQASTGGTQFNSFANGVLSIFFKPYDGEDPNLGQVEVPFSDVAFRFVIHSDGSRSGNVHIHGIHASGARNTAMQIQTNAAARGLIVNNCIYTNAGTDTRDLTIAHDALSIYGLTSLARITDVTVSNGYAANVINNAVEVAHVDGVLCERNLSRNIGGSAIIEWWDNCRNTTTRYNYGYGDPVHPQRRILGQVASAGFWLANQTDGGVADTGNTHNNNHDVYMNYMEGSMRGWQFKGGTGIKVHHNTYTCRWANPTGFSNVEGGITTGGQTPTINHSNNAYVLDSSVANLNDGIQFLRLSTATNYSGNNNVYMAPGGACSWWLNGNTRLFLSDFVTTDLAGAQEGASRTNPVNSTSAGGGVYSTQISTGMLDSSGRPASFNSILRNRGLSGLTTTVNGNAVPYTRDIEGSAMSLTFPTIGCFA
jgi:hypothetical protein